MKHEYEFETEQAVHEAEKYIFANKNIANVNIQISKILAHADVANIGYVNRLVKFGFPIAYIHEYVDLMHRKCRKIKHKLGPDQLILVVPYYCIMLSPEGSRESSGEG
jgi:hypothetical protein